MLTVRRSIRFLGVFAGSVALSCGGSDLTDPETGTGSTGLCTAGSAVPLLESVSPSDNSDLTVNQSFTRIWTLRNGGSCTWGSSIRLQYVSGPMSQSTSPVAVVGTVAPEATYAFSVAMRMPDAAGTYRDEWRLTDGAGTVTVSGASTLVTVMRGVVACGYALSSTSASFGSAGGAGSVGVTAGAGCSWTATSNASWITITGGASGTGNGTVTFAVAANGSASQRMGTLTIAGRSFTVNQGAGQACSYALSVTSASVGSDGGAVSVGVTAGAGCSWTATSNASWITITGGASGTGNGTVTFAVAVNGGASSRLGTLTIAGQSFTANQAGQSCSYALSSTSASFSSHGGTGSVGVTAGAGCSWTATSNASWITITGGASGTGNGTATYVVAANGGASSRTGTLTIAGQTFTVNQEGQPALGIRQYAIEPTIRKQQYNAAYAIDILYNGNSTLIVVDTLTAYFDKSTWPYNTIIFRTHNLSWYFRHLSNIEECSGAINPDTDSDSVTWVALECHEFDSTTRPDGNPNPPSTEYRPLWVLEIGYSILPIKICSKVTITATVEGNDLVSTSTTCTSSFSANR